MITYRIPLAALCATLLFAGCASSPEVRYYTLTTQNVPAAPARIAPASADHGVSVGPVTLPELVDRPQIVLRVAANRLRISEQNRWAEPLKVEIPRIVAENISRFVGSGNIYAHTQSAARSVQTRVLIDIQRFESVLGEAVTLEAIWMVRQAGGGSRQGHSTVREPAPGGDYDALVAAHGRALAVMSREIAAVLHASGVVTR